MKKLIIVLLSVLCFTATSYAAERFFEIKAKRFVYTPSIIKVNKGDLVRIRLISEDVTHGFFLDGYGLNTSTHPGQEGFLQFVADKPGRFTFRCSVTCGEFHPYMVGYFVVEKNLRLYLFVLLTVLLGVGSLLIILKNKPQQAHDNNPPQEPTMNTSNG
ncbi:MAG: cupredoxin domain-containing protein [Candidatus Omnitrophota bacterium]